MGLGRHDPCCVLQVSTDQHCTSSRCLYYSSTQQSTYWSPSTPFFALFFILQLVSICNRQIVPRTWPQKWACQSS